MGGIEDSKKKEKLLALRHSAEHVLTMAMLRLWPGKIKAAMGPATDDGFYFDFDSTAKLSEKDFSLIEKEMQKIIKEDLPITKGQMTVKEARKFFSSGTYKGNEYKHEWIDEIESRNEKVDVYWMGEKGKDIPATFVDICSGPHVESTGKIKAFKLLNLAGAYWRGDEKNKMLIRIYGTAFSDSKDLKKHLEMLENAEKFNHRVLGKQLKLFAIDPMVGKGLPLILPYGYAIWRELEKFILEEEDKRGYKRVRTPDLGSIDLYKASGHWDHYQHGMYAPIDMDGKKFILRPMTCPHHFAIYRTEMRSYRELPLRLAELAHQYRYEQSGELHGLIRVRMFALADSHIFCMEEQAADEVKGALDLIQYTLRTLGFSDDEYWFRLSLRDEADKVKYMQNKAMWDKAEAILKKVIKDMKVKNWAAKEGEAAFYGPKIDVQMKNIYGKEDTILTVQVDFYLPEKFDLKYIGKDNEMKRPVAIHRSSVGCFERTLAFLIEKYRGAFPVWLAPVQVKVLTLTDECLAYAQQVEKQIRDAGMRVEGDYRAETVQSKIRDAEVMKVPVILVCGSKEEKSETVAVRWRGTNKVKFGVKLEELIKELKGLIEKRMCVL